MKLPSAPRPEPPVDAAACEIENAAAAEKCWTCGCLHGSLAAIERAIPEEERSARLANAIESAASRLESIKYDCLGCEICFPAIAVNALAEAVPALGASSDGCVVEPSPRAGWPPLPGGYQTLRYHAPIAVCTLTSEALSRQIVEAAGEDLAIAGTLQTENLGIERIVQNLLANPNIRFLVVCGEDSRRQIGHLPGQSLVALSRAGLDARSRIVGAKGRRPVLRNVVPAAIDHFRRTIRVVDLVGNTDLPAILAAIRTAAAEHPGPAEPFAGALPLAAIEGALPARMTRDPAGWFVVFVDRRRARLLLEHYRNDGLLDAMVQGRSAAETYMPAIERGLLSRLDHAAYLGRELARAEAALVTGGPYVQDGAPEAIPNEASAGSCAAGCAEACP